MNPNIYVWSRRDTGSDIIQCSIVNTHGFELRVTNYGATITNIFVPASGGKKIDVVLGYDTIEEYEKGSCYFGACVGRFGGYIKDGTIQLGNKKYQLELTDGKNHLHGGLKGFDKRIWNYKTGNGSIIFSRKSPDGEEHYPGNLTVSVRYELNEDDVIKIVYDAKTDHDTVLNLTNHSYYNLNGEGSGNILMHKLMLCSDLYNVDNSDGISWVGLCDVTDTPFDFRTFKEIGKDINHECEQLRFGHGYDHNMYLGNPGILKKAAELKGDKTGISMAVYTNQSGIQLYTGNYIQDEPGKNGHIYHVNEGVCLETQYCASEKNMDEQYLYPVLKAGDKYHHECELHFSYCKKEEK